MNKTELIEHIAKQADISKAAAGRALEATIGAVRTTLKKGGTVALVGFGTFAVTKRAARTGRNPRTGAAIKIKSAKVPKFRPGKALPGRNLGTLADLILMAAPVRGLRPVRAARLVTAKVPKPTRATVPPFFNVVRTAPMVASKARPAAALEMSACLAMCSINSVLFIQRALEKNRALETRVLNIVKKFW